MPAMKKSSAKKTVSKKKAARESATKSVSVEESAAQDAADGDLLDLDEALALLKTTRPTLYRWLREGRLRGMKVGRQWRFTRADLERFLHGEAPQVDAAGAYEPLIEELNRKLVEAGGEVVDGEGHTPPEILFGLVICLGMRLGASTIHFEPFQDRILLRYRVDGVMHAAAEFPTRLYKPIVDHWKKLGKANVQINDRPQDCRVLLKVEGVSLDLRVSIVPTVFGESMTARILDKDGMTVGLDRIPFGDKQREVVEKHLAASHGMILCVGPTGCGKTTTLYAMLHHLDTPEKKIFTVEYPVELTFDGINQCMPKPHIGMHYAACIRSVMRQDPDVLMVSEIRDAETAQVAVSAALGGNVVLGGMHVEDGASALGRLLDLEVPPFLLIDVVRLVVAQRLVRRLCPHCATDYEPDQQILATARRRIEAGGLDWEALAKNWQRAVGCAECRQLGYRGRTAAHEVFELSSSLYRTLAAEGVEAMRRRAIAQGMVALPAEAVRLAAEGVTTLEEALRVMPEA